MSIGELELLAAVCGLEKFSLYLYGKIVYLYTNQAMEPLVKGNQAYRQYSARSTKVLDRLVHNNISKQNTAGNIPKLTKYLKRHPTEKAPIEVNYEEENVNKT